MTDTERLRARVQQLEAAARDFLAVLERTGNERKEAWQKLPMHGVASLTVFLNTYERTMPIRQAAAETFQTALVTDWETALASAELTDEQRQMLEAT